MKALALWAVIMEGDIERAKKLVETAIESINADPNLNDSVRESWRQEFYPINKSISNIEARQDH